MREIEELLADGRWRTPKEIASAKEGSEPGIGANVDRVKTTLEANADRFESRTGEAAKQVGRHPTAVVWQVTRASESPESPTQQPELKAEVTRVTSPIREVTSRVRSAPGKLTSESPESAHVAEEIERRLGEVYRG
ncbi:MAG: hypothetical protein ABR583_08725 [Gaiellaceae bacterium]